jgi:hypothetical protein
MIKSRIQKVCFSIKELWSAKPFFASIAVFFIVFSIYAIVYIPSAGMSAIDDHFFHFRYASLIREKGWEVINNFPWVFFSKMAQEHVRYQISLFQFALIPFTLIKNSILGLKISDIFWASLACSSFYYLLRKIRIRWAFLYVLILLSFPFFASRILMGRAFILTPVLVFWELYLASKRKYKALFFLSFFHVIWHEATFFMPIGVIGLVEISRYIIRQKIFLKNVLVGALGTIVGMSLFSGFPVNIWYFLTGLISESGNGVSNSAMKMTEGSELSAISLLSFWSRSDIAVFAMTLSFAVFVYFYLKDRKDGVLEGQKDNFGDWRTITYPAFLLVFLFFCFSILSNGRLLDFYFVGAVFLLALIFQRVSTEDQAVINIHLRKYIFSGIIIVFVMASLNSLSSIKESVRNNNYEGIKESSEWIKERSSQSEVVFLYDWDNFPIAFSYNQKNYYTMGIEPRMLSNYNPNLYWKWHNIFLYNYYCEFPRDCADDVTILMKSLGEDQDKIDEFRKENSQKIIDSIENDFKSRFIISNSYSFNDLLRKNSDLIKDSFSYKSNAYGENVDAFELK